MIIFNHGIVRILVKKKSKHPYARVITKKVGPFFGKKVEKKFLSQILSDDIPIENVDWAKSYLEGDIVYSKPHCIIYMADKSEKNVYFETVEELEVFVEDLKSKAPHIII